MSRKISQRFKRRETTITKSRNKLQEDEINLFDMRDKIIKQKHT